MLIPLTGDFCFLREPDCFSHPLFIAREYAGRITDDAAEYRTGSSSDIGSDYRCAIKL